MDIPVAFIIFKRPDTAARVFAEIAKARPSKLFVIADGPRADRPDEAEKCMATRAIIDRVDWECEVFKNYSDVNLGCGKRPATGISWVFEHVEGAMILEDDCVPHPTFFRFCQELLEKYRDDTRVMNIGGLSIYQSRTPYSYDFSRLPACVGGWATWRRAWQHWDMQIKMWPVLHNTSWLLDILGNVRAAEHWKNIFDRTYTDAGNVNYWDYQWVFSCWAQSGLSIVPANTNLICNIGFGPEATHTKVADERANLATAELVFPLRHPPHVIRNREMDCLFVKDTLPAEQRQPAVHRQLRRKLSTILPSSLRNQLSNLRNKCWNSA
jgi:hypothetical protein